MAKKKDEEGVAEASDRVEDPRLEGEEEPLVIRDGRLYLEVKELLVNTKVSRGEYNRNQVYGHLIVKPAVPWLIGVPVDEEVDLGALKIVLEKFQDLVTDVVREKASTLEVLDREEQRASVMRTVGASGRHSSTGVSVSTPVRTIEGGEIGVRPSVEASVDGGPSDDEEDF